MPRILLTTAMFLYACSSQSHAASMTQVGGCMHAVHKEKEEIAGCFDSFTIF